MTGRAHPPAARAVERVERSSGPDPSRLVAAERVRTKASGVVPSPTPLAPPHGGLTTGQPKPVRSLVEPTVDVDSDGDADADADRPRQRQGGGELSPPPAARGPRLQRSSLPELFAAMTTPTPEEGGLLVEDDVATLTEGQLRKVDFLRELRAEVRRVADEELRRVGRSAADCPYIEAMLDRYDRRTAAETERAVRRYAPEARGVREARGYLRFVTDRLALGIRRWAESGRMPDDLPSDELMSLGRAGGWVGAIAGLAGLRAPEAGAAGGGGGAGRGGGTPQRQAAGPSPGRVDAGALRAGLGPGRPLDGTTRARMEAGLGHSFAAVRLHADDHAAALNRDLAARAFTIGPHVVLGAGAPAVGTVEGDALLAHELAHVVQQGTAAPVGDVPVGQPGDPLEREADDAAEAVVRGLHGPSRRGPHPVSRGPQARHGGLRLQRCGASYRSRTAADLERALPMVATLRDRYGVAVTEESSNWSADELDSVNEAMALLTADERGQIPGLTFVRVASTGIQGGGLDAQAAHQFGVIGGAAQPTRVRRILVADSFANLRGHQQVSLLAHELGHSIEGARALEARFAIEQARAAIDPARSEADRVGHLFVDGFNAAQGRIASYPPAANRAAAPFLDALGAAAQAFVGLRDLANVPAIADLIRDRPGRDAALTAALTARDTAWAQLQATAPDNPAIADNRDVITRMDAAVAALRAYLTTRVQLQTTTEAHDATVTRQGGTERSRRLAELAAIVDRENLRELRWPGDREESYTSRVLRREGPARFHEEMFAEAFSMWRTNRQALQDQAPALVRFFDDGGHLR